jgi:acyl-coenzyme A thioesterase PaaI-like protein
MRGQSAALVTWQRLNRLPGGKRLFSRMVCRKAPYFASIRPQITTLRPGRAEVRMRKQHAVLNHLGGVHAIAMCNMAELAGGMVTDVTIPGTHRWIPKGMTVDYLQKADSDLRAVAELEFLPALGDSAEIPVTVDVFNADGEAVLRAVIRMWLSRKPDKPGR